jgi:microsomal epoxide hydrolase
MWLELILASVLGFVIYWFVSRDKEETLPLEDGWWGPGSKPSAKEDESIRPFKVETSDEEIKVRHPFPGRAEPKGRSCCVPLGPEWGHD